MLGILVIIFGGALLLVGRKLFWLFVGVIGFVIGIQVATRFFHGSELITIVAGVVLGIGYQVREDPRVENHVVAWRSAQMVGGHEAAMVDRCRRQNAERRKEIRAVRFGTWPCR